MILRLSGKPLKKQKGKGHIAQPVSGQTEHCAALYCVHWEQRTAPKPTNLLWACHLFRCVGRPVLFPERGNGKIYRAAAAWQSACRYEQPGFNNYNGNCKGNTGSPQQGNLCCGGARDRKAFLREKVYFPCPVKTAPVKPHDTRLPLPLLRDKRA